MKLTIGIAAWFAIAAVYGQPAPFDGAEMVPPAGPGVFTAKPAGPGSFRLVLAGHQFTSRGDVEKYLAYRAARLTIEEKADWFTFTEERSKGETAVPVPQRDPEGPRYSFRMKFFRPVWRYKTKGSAEWKRWSPFAGAPFLADDPKSISDFEVAASIVVRKAPMDDADPLGFEARALSDLLVNQVSPPK